MEQRDDSACATTAARISKEARDTVIEELEEAVGKETVARADLDVDRAISERPQAQVASAWHARRTR